MSDDRESTTVASWVKPLVALRLKPTPSRCTKTCDIIPRPWDPGLTGLQCAPKPGKSLLGTLASVSLVQSHLCSNLGYPGTNAPYSRTRAQPAQGTRCAFHNNSIPAPCHTSGDFFAFSTTRALTDLLSAQCLVPSSIKGRRAADVA